MKFNIICSDPPWGFNDKLEMSSVHRGAEANYSVLNQETLKKIPIQDITDDDALLCLWVPSSLLADGLELMQTWGFEQKQTFVWVKTKKSPLENLFKKALHILDKWTKDISGPYLSELCKLVIDFDLNNILSFNMGRIFRQTHEICLIGTKGKIYKHLANKSQRSVCLDKATKHSEKTEMLQDRLDLMFPNCNKLEMFARRKRKGWVCIGNEVDGIGVYGEDIFDSIEKLKNV